ncbi:hypothetical protein [Azospirillum argentinense]
MSKSIFPMGAASVQRHAPDVIGLLAPFRDSLPWIERSIRVLPLRLAAGHADGIGVEHRHRVRGRREVGPAADAFRRDGGWLGRCAGHLMDLAVLDHLLSSVTAGSPAR